MILGIWAGKLTQLLLRLLKRRGTSLPGLVALKVAPHLLRTLGKQLESCILVTGTNGKTTTVSLLREILRHDPEHIWISNAEGANMTQGITACFLQACNVFGRLKAKHAVLEVDEATMPQVVPYLPVTHVVITNVFRDQLDRYGEVDGTIQKLIQALQDASVHLIANGDDPLVHYVAMQTNCRTSYYAMEAHSRILKQHQQIRDGAFCLYCGHELEYEYFHYGQMGLYRCPHCDFAAPVPMFRGMPQQEGLEIRTDEQEFLLRTHIRGLYNKYNVLAAASAALLQEIGAEGIQKGISAYQPMQGRMQIFTGTPLRILNLIKNPTGCNSVLQTIDEDPGRKTVCVAINDYDADGRDVSWLWDSDFETYAPGLQAKRFICSGTRAGDMAVRLKYAGIDPALITVEPNLKSAHDLAIQDTNLPAYFMTTYTALFPMQQIIEEGLKHDEKTPHRALIS
ncbi:MurT ligase domain-containing protein [Fodinisporobacter ferrooxydans]|uniref:Lipid II isoglutaminyl synthase (glutamine-hydrolyzing) subunit MurT n=1 Tax=Fodinisporobacter ferrooxydans TaxID=2901836 RepID=A0ABY4CIY8_9BACL|nr:MurT ligase domain-containing protein [Alicyclobacillaceae bacterium MYW30-H2]